jgi:hypothetical protein
VALIEAEYLGVVERMMWEREAPRTIDERLLMVLVDRRQGAPRGC